MYIYSCSGTLAESIEPCPSVRQDPINSIEVIQVNVYTEFVMKKCSVRTAAYPLL